MESTTIRNNSDTNQQKQQQHVVVAASARRSETRPTFHATKRRDVVVIVDAANDHNHIDDDGDESRQQKQHQPSDGDDNNNRPIISAQQHQQGYEVIIPTSSDGNEYATGVGGGGVGLVKSSSREDDEGKGTTVIIPSHNSSGHSTSVKPSITTARVVVVSNECATQRDERSRPLPPSGHIYALREVIHDNGSNINTTTHRGRLQDSLLSSSCNNDDEIKKKKEEEESSSLFAASALATSAVSALDSCSININSKTTLACSRPRIISSRVVRTTEEVYRQLEDTTVGTVLCPSWRTMGGDLITSQCNNDDAADTASYTYFRASGLASSSSSLFIAAVSTSYIQKQMEQGLNDGGGGHHYHTGHANDLVSSSPHQKQTKKKWTSRLLPSVKLFGSVKRSLGRNKNKNRRTSKNEIMAGEGKENRSSTPAHSSDKTNSNKQHHHPKMIIKNGIIDWENSRLDDCRAISQSSTFVAYSAAGSSCGYNGIISNRRRSRSSSVIASSTSNQCSPIVPPSTLGATIFGDDAVIYNSIRPINEIVCVDKSLGIYISETGLSATDCQNIINVSEFTATSRGGWSSYTYAKQTLGCRENDQLAFVCARPVMTACATIRKHLMNNDDGVEMDNEESDIIGGNNGGSGSSAQQQQQQRTDNSSDGNDDNGILELSSSHSSSSTISRPSPLVSKQKKKPKKQELVLDVREPHVVKYDTTKTERQKLDMHTDKSEWTFLIALTEGRGTDYNAGGTYFQALGSTVHLQRSQMLIFRGKLRHCGVAIQSGCRYLLVGFLVPCVKTSCSTSGASWENDEK